jgi:hypothetical protein
LKQADVEVGFVFFENMGRSERFRRSNVEMCREAKAGPRGPIKI